MHVDLRISKPRHTIALSLDDTPVKVWVDPEGFVGEGTGMRFVQNLGTGLKLSNLRITEWDGVFADNSTNSIDPARDSFWPENRDRMSGTIESISNGKLTARTANGPVVLPLAQLKSMDFAHPQPAASPTQAATVRATFADGGALNFVLESWRPDEMVIKSPDFGRVKINPAVFTRLQFLSPDKKPAEGPKG
jgi:hypothetical protein